MPIIFQKVYNLLAPTKLCLPLKIIIMCQNTIKEDIIFLNSNLLKRIRCGFHLCGSISVF